MALDLLGLGALLGLVVGLLAAPGRWLREARLAAAMEEAAGLAPGSVLGSLELSRSVPPGVSLSLVRQAQRGVAQRLGDKPSRLAGTLGSQTSAWLRRGALAALLSSFLLLSLAFTSPGRTRGALSGLGDPIEMSSAPVLSPLRVSPGTVRVPRGSPLEILVEGPGRRQLILHWQAVGDVLQSSSRETADGRARFALPEVFVSLEYWASAPDGAQSPHYTVTPEDPLYLAELSVDLTFPSYTGRAPERYGGDLPPLVIPVGTRVQVNGRVSGPLVEAVLRPRAEGAEELDLEVDGARFQLGWAPTRSGIYDWMFRSPDGQFPRSPADPLELVLVRDSAPSIDVVFPGRDTVLPLALRQSLVIEARDDYGMTELELVAFRVSSFGERGQPLLESLPVAGARRLIARPVLDVSGWQLVPGDTVRYFARVRDNSPRGQWAESPTFALWVPSSAELGWEAQRRLEEAASRLEELARQATEAEESARDLERRTRRREAGDDRSSGRSPGGQGDPLDFQEREEVQQALGQQEGVADEVERLKSELREMSESLADAGYADPDLRQDLRELQELLEEMATPELRQGLQELAESLDRMDRSQTQQAMESVSEAQGDLRRRLEESLDRFRRAAADQEVRAATREADGLAREQELMAGTMREGGDLDRQASQQEELRERTEGLESHLENLDQRLSELGEQAAGQEAEKAGEGTRSAQRSMADAARQARAGDSRGASESADEAAETLRQTADQLRQSGEEGERREGEATQRALQRAAGDALSLARRQEELRQRMGDAGPEEMSEMRGEEGALLEGVRRMSENLGQDLGESPSMNRQMSGTAGQAMQAMQETLRAMEDPRSSGSSPQAAAEEALDALNQLALQAMVSAQEAQQGEGSAEQMMQRIEALAQQQGDLAGDASSLIPLELSAQSMAGQVQQLAEGQETVASDLDELAREPGAGEQALGDLEAMAREARELADRLAGGRLEPETLRRQERLFHRLLDAGRTLEREERSEERESRTAGAVEARDVPALTPEVLNALQYAYPDAEQLQSLPPAQRQMVLEYFERLNRAATTRRPPPGGGP
jgi:hypothetical protein